MRSKQIGYNNKHHTHHCHFIVTLLDAIVSAAPSRKMALSLCRASKVPKQQLGELNDIQADPLAHQDPSIIHRIRWKFTKNHYIIRQIPLYTNSYLRCRGSVPADCEQCQRQSVPLDRGRLMQPGYSAAADKDQIRTPRRLRPDLYKPVRATRLAAEGRDEAR